MSRKTSCNLIIALAAAAALAAPLLGSTASYARGFAPHFGGHPGIGHPGTGHFTLHHAGLTPRTGRFRPFFPRHPRPPIKIGHWHPHHHHHWIFRFGHWVDVDDADVSAVDPAPVTKTVTPGPCTCLTKTYTPSGLVVFADICTKESASAPATDDTADASKAPSTPVPAKSTPISEVPTRPDYAGKNYEDYLADNPGSKPVASVPTSKDN